MSVRNELIKSLIKEKTKEITKSTESARRYLIEVLKVYNEDGSINMGTN